MLLVIGSRVDVLCGVEVSMWYIADSQFGSSDTQSVLSFGVFAITTIRSGNDGVGVGFGVRVSAVERTSTVVEN